MISKTFLKQCQEQYFNFLNATTNYFKQFVLEGNISVLNSFLPDDVMS